MFKVNNKDTRTTSSTSFWCLYCYLWTYFTTCSSVSIVNFEQVNAGWKFCIIMDSYLVQELDLIASPFECEKSWKIRNAKIFKKKKNKKQLPDKVFRLWYDFTKRPFHWWSYCAGCLVFNWGLMWPYQKQPP